MPNPAEHEEVYAATLKDLDSEREKRWRAEHEIKRLTDMANDRRDHRSNETILQDLAEKHQLRLADEKSKFQDLTAILEDYKVLQPSSEFPTASSILQARLRSTEDQLSSYKKAQETNLQLIKTLESSLSQMESEKNEVRITEVRPCRPSPPLASTPTSSFPAREDSKLGASLSTRATGESISPARTESSQAAAARLPGALHQPRTATQVTILHCLTRTSSFFLSAAHLQARAGQMSR